MTPIRQMPDAPDSDTDLHQTFRAPKSSDLVARHIRGLIVRGALPPKAALPSTSELMRKFGVSRPTLREAYRVLESEGLIIVHRGAQGGARVQTPNPDVAARYAGMMLQHSGATLRDLADARQMMEPPAAGLLAKRQDPKDVEALLESLSLELRSDLDHEVLWYEPFHIKLIELTGNLTLTLFARMTGLIMQAAKTRYLATPQVAGSEGERAIALATKSHHRLVDLIREGDVSGAESFWARHLEAAADRILSTIPEVNAIELLN